MKRVLLAIFLFMCSLSFGVLAQADSSLQDAASDRSSSLYAVVPAFATSAPSALNGVLVANGYPQLPRGSFSWGLGAHYRWNRFVLGIEAMVSHQNRQRSDIGSELVRMAVTSNLYSAFYVYRRPGLSLYPYLALSATDTRLFVSKPTGSSSLSGLLATPGNTVQLSHFSGGFLFGFGIDLQDQKRENSVFESIRIGYRMSPESAYPWESSFSTFSDAPADSFNYWFFQLNLGTARHWSRAPRR
jgi:hypothetical protein